MEVKDLFPEVPVGEHWEDTLRRRYRGPSIPYIIQDCIVKAADAAYEYKGIHGRCTRCGKLLRPVWKFDGITERDPTPESTIWFSKTFRCDQCGTEMFFLPVRCHRVDDNIAWHYHCVDCVPEAVKNQIKNQIKDCIRKALAQYAGQVRVADPTDDSPLVEMNKITETTLNQILSELKEGGLMICERP